MPDLKDRLRTVVEERDRLVDQAKALEPDIDLLMRMIEREYQRVEEQEKQRAAEGVRRPDESLPDFIFNTIKKRPVTKEDLRELAIAAGYGVDGRSIHATVVNLMRVGKVEEVSTGIFAPAMSFDPGVP